MSYSFLFPKASFFTKGADLAILEATANEKTAKDSEVHLSIKEATEIGKTAKEFILIHKGSPDMDKYKPKIKGSLNKHIW